ncbi:unnamed protein product [Prorocentrum cordatum]|uniref:Uncharacterized protein n=1 Tax=Prorocentrum cordatum TaxID=2364126 RepID=A0ABN9QVD3_9DINO|nr:unnamed protein product [Polarella glacialis]
MALYQRKEVAQYTDAEDLFDALACTVEGQHSVRLVRMSWLLQQRGSVLRRRQELPEEEAGGRGGCGKVAPMIAMSFCWDAREHPDPEGLQMNLVIATLEQERGTYSQTDGEFAGFSEMGVCWDCPSLLHGDPDKAHEAHAQEAADDAKRTPAEKAAFKHVLHETIDLWYAHQARTVFLLTQHLREWGSTRECGYDQSGWTTCWPVGPARLEFEGMPPPTPEQVAGLGGCLRLCARLEKLDLRRCNVGPAGWESLARTLPSAPRLEELYLQDKGIGGDGAEALAQALPSTLGLEYLDLSGNGIGGDGAEAALRAAWGRRNLDYLARGVGRELGIPAGDVVVASVFYDLFAAADSPLREKACTGVIAQTTSGDILHGRNLDYDFAEKLAKTTLVVDFMRNGSQHFTAVTFGPIPNFNTAVRYGSFSLTHDERDQGSIAENLFDMIVRGRVATFSQIREAMDTVSSFDDAVTFFSTAKLSSASYFILGGVRAGEGAVITRNRDSVADAWKLNVRAGRWYLVETNYDHDKQPGTGDDRRHPLIRAMDATGQDNITAATLWEVISTRRVNTSAGERPPLNPGTVYSTVMGARHPESFKTVVRTSFSADSAAFFV